MPGSPKLPSLENEWKINLYQKVGRPAPQKETKAKNTPHLTRRATPTTQHLVRLFEIIRYSEVLCSYPLPPIPNTSPAWKLQRLPAIHRPSAGAERISSCVIFSLRWFSKHPSTSPDSKARSGCKPLCGNKYYQITVCLSLPRTSLRRRYIPICENFHHKKYELEQENHIPKQLQTCAEGSRGTLWLISGPSGPL